MSTAKKVFVGLSGGVDSAVSAALLKKEGYDVTGIFVRIALPGYPCSAGEDRREALRVAAHLQIPFIDIDLSKEYREAVFTVSMEGYRQGGTPNPDALCNREIKFGLLFDFAMAQGADFLATGHYARTKHTQERKGKGPAIRRPGLSMAKPFSLTCTQLLRGADAEKDQSYFLWAVPEERLAKTLFPVGNLHKKTVRALAKKFQLPNALRRDSQGLCFLGGVSMEEALMRELAPVGGPVLNQEGETIGTHRGAALYTMGERHGFDVGAKDPDAKSLYVIDKDVRHNTITVAPRSMPRKSAHTVSVVLAEENWIGPVVGQSYEARFRYRQKLFPAKLQRHQGRSRVEITTREPIPIGQSLVLYDGTRCVGGGVIARA